MALLTAVAGAYVGTYTPNSSSGASGTGTGAGQVGILSDSGFRLVWTVHQQKIGNDGTDRFGNTLLTSIQRGADWNIILQCREYSITAMNMAWPYGKAAATALSSVLGGIGWDVANSFAGVLVMTAVAATPAASNPATLTASAAAASPGGNSSLEFTSRLREVPMNLTLYPYTTTISAVSYNVWFVTT